MTSKAQAEWTVQWIEGKGTQGTAILTPEGEPLGEGCPHNCPLQLPPLTFMDHSLPMWSPGKEAIHFVVSTGTLLRGNGDTTNSYLGHRYKVAIPGQAGTSPQQCPSTFGAWENPD